MIRWHPGAICKKVEFSSDGYRLKGTLHLPAAQSPAIVIGSHGLLSSSDSPKQIELARKCNSLGIAFFRFDHRGCGESQGDFTKVTSLSARSNDLLSAVRLMRENAETGNRIGLFGSSLGGTACLSAAHEACAESLVIFAAPVRSSTVNHTIEKQSRAYDPQRLLDKLDLDFDISDKLGNIYKILIFHGEADKVVPFSNALEIYQRVGNPKKLIRQPGGDHLMSHKAHQKQFIKQAALWFKSSFGM